MLSPWQLKQINGLLLQLLSQDSFLHPSHSSTKRYKITNQLQTGTPLYSLQRFVEMTSFYHSLSLSSSQNTKLPHLHMTNYVLVSKKEQRGKEKRFRKRKRTMGAWWRRRWQIHKKERFPNKRIRETRHLSRIENQGAKKVFYIHKIVPQCIFSAVQRLKRKTIQT